MANIPLKLSFLSVATSEIHKCVHNFSVACKAGAIFWGFFATNEAQSPGRRTRDKCDRGRRGN